MLYVFTVFRYGSLKIYADTTVKTCSIIYNNKSGQSVKPITLHKHSAWYAENYSPAYYVHTARYRGMADGALANISTAR